MIVVPAPDTFNVPALSGVLPRMKPFLTVRSAPPLTSPVFGAPMARLRTVAVLLPNRAPLPSGSAAAIDVASSSGQTPRRDRCVEWWFRCRPLRRNCLLMDASSCRKCRASSTSLLPSWPCAASFPGGEFRLSVLRNEVRFAQQFLADGLARNHNRNPAPVAERDGTTRWQACALLDESGTVRTRFFGQARNG